MRFLGARVVLTPASQKGSGMVAKADELARVHGWWRPQQFDNPANADVHARTTAVEILDDFADARLDYWVTGFGTGGTLNGVSRVLRAKSPATRIIVCEPDNSAILASGVPQMRNSDGSHGESHPGFRPHLMQGWSPDFIPNLAEEVIADRRIDEFIPINGNDALACARDLARKEGIFVGISAGATFAGALRVAESAPDGANILCMLPDTGERYLSTPLFEDIPAEMTDEELDISRSSPGYRFDVCAPAAPANADADIPLDESAVAMVESLVTDAETPVLMFALEWCEFCWSVRKVLARCEIPYQAVDLDAVAYQEGNRGGKIRQALRARTGWNTFPQIFIGGQFVGGCTDLFDGIRDGSIRRRLDECGIPHDASVNIDPYTYLPKWLHPR